MDFLTQFLADFLAGAVLYLPFVWLMWASTYLNTLVRMARLNRWGFGQRVEEPKEWEGEP
jgi:hypothetical protein